jgi:hypothetical protein
VSGPLADEYDPASVEAAWYDWWVAQVRITPKIWRKREREREERRDMRMW